MKKLKKRVEEEADYHKTNVERTKKAFQDSVGDQKYWKPTPGRHYFRILPPWGKAAKGSFFFFGGLHYGFKVGGRDRALPCRMISGLGPCPACDFKDALKELGEEYEEVVKGVYAKKKYWVNVVLRDKASNNLDDGKIRIYGASKKFFEMLKSALDDDDIGDVTDIETGHDIKVERTGTGRFDTRYEHAIRPKTSPLGLPDGWEKKLHQLHEVVLEFMSEKEMKKVILANYPEEAAAIGWLEKPSKKKKKHDEDEDEDDDTSDDEDEDDDEDDEDEED